MSEVYTSACGAEHAWGATSICIELYVVDRICVILGGEVRMRFGERRRVSCRTMRIYLSDDDDDDEPTQGPFKERSVSRSCALWACREPHTAPSHVMIMIKKAIEQNPAEPREQTRKEIHRSQSLPPILSNSLSSPFRHRVVIPT
jgi:hypothetical protein